MTTKFYLRDANFIGSLQPQPSSATWLASPTYTVSIGSPNRSLSTTIGTGPTQIMVWPVSGYQQSHFGKFVSLPLAAQTFGAGTWHLIFAPLESNAAANIQIGCSVFVWRPSTGATVGSIYDARTALSTEWATSTTNDGRDATFTGANVTCQNGDVLVLELWAIEPPVTSGIVSTADDTPLHLASDFQVIVRVISPDWTPSTESVLAAKWSASDTDRSWYLAVKTNGTLLFQYQTATPATVRSLISSQPNFVNGTAYWIKVKHTGSNGGIAFSWHADQEAEPADATFTALNSTVFAAPNTAINSTVAMEVGSTTGGASSFTGTILRCRVMTTTGSIGRVDYYPALDNTLNQTAWLSSSTGETWINTHTFYNLTFPFSGTVEPSSNSTTTTNQAAATITSPQTVTFYTSPALPDPTKTGLVGYGCTGTLAIQWGTGSSNFMLVMNCPAWDISDLTPLLIEYSVRGDDRRVPGVTGVVPYRRRYDATEHALQMWITGDVDKDGNINSDAKKGLQTNLQYLRSTIVNPDIPNGMPTNGTRLAQLTTPLGAVMSAYIHVLGLRTSDLMIADDHAWVNAVLQVNVPGGVFV